MQVISPRGEIERSCGRNYIFTPTGNPEFITAQLGADPAEPVYTIDLPGLRITSAVDDLMFATPFELACWLNARAPAPLPEKRVALTALEVIAGFEKHFGVSGKFFESSGTYSAFVFGKQFIKLHPQCRTLWLACRIGFSTYYVLRP